MRITQELSECLLRIEAVIDYYRNRIRNSLANIRQNEIRWVDNQVDI